MTGTRRIKQTIPLRDLMDRIDAHIERNKKVPKPKPVNIKKVRARLDAIASDCPPMSATTDFLNHVEADLGSLLVEVEEARAYTKTGLQA